MPVSSFKAYCTDILVDVLPTATEVLINEPVIHPPSQSQDGSSHLFRG